MLKRYIQNFLSDTSGAVTLPWIAGAGFVVIIGASATGMMQSSSEGLADDNKSFFEDIDNTGGGGYD